MTIQALLALPGIVIHELGHYFFCHLVRAKVREVVFFQADGPSGHVIHTVPRHVRQHAVIVVGPLLLNSVLGFLLFRSAISEAPRAFQDTTVGSLLMSAQVVLAAFLGASITLQAIPSRADAESLWNVAIGHLQKGNLLAVLAIPPAGALLVANQLRRYWIDWGYVVLLAALAWRFPNS